MSGTVGTAACGTAAAVQVSRVRELDAAQTRAARKLEQAVFGDDAAFLDALFSAAADERYLSIRVGDDLAAGCFVFGATLYTGGRMLRGGYLYALGTAAPYRGRGFAHALLGEAIDRAGDFLLTVPATRELFDFYRRAGFTQALPGCMAVGGDSGSPAPAGMQPGDYADAVRAAKRHGGLLLGAPLFELSMRESGSTAFTVGDGFCTVRDGRLTAAIGIAPDAPVTEKALLFCGTPLRPHGIFADQLLEA